jgi:MYXO-CTERM domain-containing protein
VPAALLAVAVAARAPLDVPVRLGRDEAQRLARIELAKPIYTGDGEPWTQRLLRWLLEKVTSVIDAVGGSSPLGWFGLLGLALLVAIVVVVVRRRTGRLSRGAATRSLFGGAERSAVDLRAEADRYAASGAWAEAVRARLRAVVRDLEDRGLVDARPGRTADEIARDAGRELPSAAGELRAGARLFDDIWYGGRPAGPAAYARLVAVDEAVAAARPHRAGSSPDRSMAVPR